MPDNAALAGMDLIDRIREIAARMRLRIAKCDTEEATKNALVMPVLQHVLGYEVFDPHQVMPEFTADVGTKKHEKVDYAILSDDQPMILIECKKHGTPLENAPANQLYRYFSVTPAHFGILTDGQKWRFFSDLSETNKMDAAPFFEFDFFNFTDEGAEELRRFTRVQFNVDSTIEAARDLKYTREIKRLLAAEWRKPSEEFVRYLAGRVYPGLKTSKVIALFDRICRPALHAFLNEEVKRRLQAAINDEEPDDEKETVGGGDKPSTPPPATMATTVRMNGETRTFRNSLTAMLHVLGTLAANRPDFYGRCAEHPGFQGRTRRYIGRDPGQMFDKGTPEQWAAWTTSLDDGWFVVSNLSRNQQRNLIRDACEANGVDATVVELVFGSEMPSPGDG